MKLKKKIIIWIQETLQNFLIIGQVLKSLLLLHSNENYHKILKFYYQANILLIW